MLGDAELEITRIIVVEPDRGGGFSSFAPRVLLAQADLEDTGLLQPASRVSYRLAVAAPEDWSASRGDAAVRAFVSYAEERIKAVPLRGVRVESLQSGRPEMQQTLDRARKFLNLVALLAALLAAVAVGIAAREFASRHLDDCAMLRVLGMSQRRIAGAYTLEFGLIGLAASVAGRPDRPGGALRLRLAAGRVGGLGTAAAGAVAGAVRHRCRHDLAAGFRAATGAAAVACAAAARDPS